MKVVYIAGKYSGRTHDGRSYSEIHRNIFDARDWAIRVMQTGGVVALCPHLNSMHMELDFSGEQDFWYEADLELLRRCDAVFLIPGWQHTRGACIENDFARSNGIPVFEDLPSLAAAIKTVGSR